MRLAEAPQLLRRAFQGGFGRRAPGIGGRQEVQPLGPRIDAVDDRQLLAHLRRQQPAGIGQRRFADHAPADRLAFQPVHEEEGHAEYRRVDAQPARPGRPHAAAVRDGKHPELLRARQGLVLNQAAQVAAQHEGMPPRLRSVRDFHVHGPRIAAGPAGQLPRRRDPSRAADRRGQPGFQPSPEVV